MVNGFILKYVPGAVALTDPPLHLIDIFKQRRRWINGSLFAGIHVLDHIASGIWYSNHSLWRKIVVLVLYTYMMINMMFGLLLVGSLLAAYSIFMKAAFGENTKCSTFHPATIADQLYASVLIMFIIMCITKPISKARYTYVLLSCIFGVMYVFMLFAGFFYLY